VGGRKPDQVLRNLAGVELELGSDVTARLDAITEPLRACLGANADMWECERESRIR
jgi:hypothetical protein